MSLIEIKDVVKRYDKHVALDHVSLNVSEGEVYGLLGPNGAGKTTLIRILNQIIRQDEGEVRLDGRALTPTDVMHMGYLPEERGLYKKMKVIDQIEFIGRLKGMSKRDARTAAMMWLEKLGLAEWASKKIEALSKGMAQKVQFISTVVHRPKLLIFDEPFSGFDPVNVEQLKREIIELNRDGSTILFSTHNMASVEEICREITLIDCSHVVLQGDVYQIRQQFKKNLFRITIAEPVLAPNESLYSINSLEPNSVGGCGAVVALAPGVTMRETIAFLNERYTILGFEEILPSMNEIFIETVTKEHE
ncbi:MAG: ATP-binding cassette domain-containing protein [Muribaculum sp.]|nr:ATP-binding cassette domain-containing protein [Muribaculum sp.]